MKKNVLGFGLAFVSLGIFSSVAFAASMSGDTMMKGDAMKSDSMMPSSAMMMHPPKPMILTVSASGHGLLRGVVTAVTADSLSIAGWGGTWTVQVTGDTTLAPSSTLADIAVGDFIGAIGSVSESAPTLTAEYVRDWTAKHDVMMKGGTMKNDHMMSTSTGAMMTH